MKASRAFQPRAVTILEFLLLVLLLSCAIAFGFADLLVEKVGDARLRSAVARARSEERSLAVAIESYYVDYGSYPMPVPVRDFARNPELLENAGGGALKTMHNGGGGVIGLTTPIAYITTYFPDHFAPEKDLPFAYHTDGPGWVLFSCGPDRRYDINPITDYTSKGPQPPIALILKSYDPTNGLVSRGDIWRVRE